MVKKTVYDLNQVFLGIDNMIKVVIDMEVKIG